MQEIKLEYMFTVNEAGRAALEINKSRNSMLIFRIIGIIGLIGLPINYVFSDANIFDFIPGLAVAIFFICLPWIVVLAAKRNAKKTSNINQLWKWKINDNELHFSTEGAETKFEWANIIKIHERNTGFLLFTQPLLAHWIPKHAFQVEKDMESFRSFTHQKQIEYKGKSITERLRKK